jgi:ketosteroid isomerase-like protein
VAEVSNRGLTREGDPDPWTLKGKDGAELDHGKYVVIWKKEAGGWKLHRDIWNSSQAPAH